jgi:hypothetical protein
VLISGTGGPQLSEAIDIKRLTVNSGNSLYLNNQALTVADSDGFENQGTMYYSTGVSSDISLTDTDSGTAVYNFTRDIRDYGAEDYFNLTIDGAAVTVTLTADLKVNGNLTFLNGGTLDVNGYTLIVDGDVTGTGTLSVADGMLIVKEDLTVSTLTATSGTIQVGGIFNTSFTAGTSTVEFIDASIPSKIYNANTFHNLNITTPGKRVIFENTVTQTVTNLMVTGTLNNEVQLISDSDALIWDISAATSSVHYAYVKDSTAASTINAVNSTDGGNNNVNWVFNPAGQLDHFAVTTVNEQVEDRAFSITITAQDTTSATVTGFTGTVSLSDRTGTIFPSTSGSFTAGVLTMDVTIADPDTGVVITVTDGTVVGQSNAFDVIAYTPSSGLAGYWKLDEVVGTSASDSSGGGNDGTLVNGALWAAGKIDGGLDFDGVDDYVDIANDSAFDLSAAVTVAAWIKVDTFTKLWQSIVTKGDGTWRLMRNDATNNLKFSGTGLSPNGATGSVNVNDGLWHHAVGVYDGSKMYLYIDGNEDASVAVTGTLATNDFNVFIGENAQTVNRHFDGMIDDVRIYNRALSAAEIKAMYEDGSPRVTNVNSVTADGNYSDTDIIDITVTFTTPVTVTGNPRLLLETGTTDRYAVYQSGTGTDTLTFRYTVQAGDNSNDLDYKAEDSLELNGGTIRDTGDTINADLTLPYPGTTGSLGNSRNFVLVSLKLTNSILASDNSYVDVTFSEAVYNTGGGSGALETSDFSLTFTQNGGNAISAGILSVTNTVGGALTGGESVIRVNLSITGTSSGVETVEIKPADSASIYDAAGHAAGAAETTGALTLNAHGWYDLNWGYRIKITLDGTKVTGSLTNFPYLVYIASNASLAANARSDVGFEGFDILFTSDDGTTKLDHETEKYVTGTGELVAWVEIPSLSAGVDTDIYMYYGYASAADQSNAAGVWDSNYKGVLHLKETAGVQVDSTTNGNDGTASVTTQGSAAGLANGADELGGTAEYISMGTTNWNVNQGTVSLWIYANDFPAGGGGYIFGHTTDPAYASRMQLYTDDVNGNLDLGLGDTHAKDLNIHDFDISTWYQVVLTWDGTNYEVYVDGVSKTSGTYTGLTALNTFADIGNHGNSANRNESFHGIIDEVRASDIVRPIEWIQTSYNNQSDAAGSSSTGSAEPRYVTIDSVALAADNSYVDVTFNEGVYTDISSNPVVAGDLNYEFAANGGTATGITIDSVTNTSGGALTGGETTVRVHITVTGGASGAETIRIKPFDGASIYNIADTAMEAAQQTGLMTLNSPAWYNSSWLYRMKITLDSTKVTANQTNFPYLVYIASNASLSTNARSDGFDILFTSDDKVTKLDHEIEQYVTGTGELVAWVEIPSLSSTVDTDIYMYYGNTSAADQSNAAGVWDSNYAGVWHLGETSGGAGAIKDSTSNNNDGTDSGGPTFGQSGQIGNSLQLNGTDDYIDCGNNATLDVNYITIEFWLNINTWVDNQGIIAKGDDAYRQYWIWTYNSAGSFEIDEGTNYNDVWLPTAGQWEHLVLTYDGSNVVAYRNGTQENIYAQTTGPIDATVQPLLFGLIPGYSYFDGKLDEIRISNFTRSVGWIETGYNNQSDPAGSSSAGPPETEPPTIDSAALAGNNSYVDVTFNTGVYSTAGGSGALDTADFNITFSANGGTATGASITGVTKTDSNPLTGGETVVRVDLNISGSPSGVETIEIKPVDSVSIYNVGGIVAADTETTGQLTLNLAGWYSAEWTRRMKITIDSTKVSGAGSLTDYPMLISIASNADLASGAKADGFDILFTGDDKVTKLDHEIEKYVTATGELVAWVKIPSLSATVDTDIYMYYSNSTASDQSNEEGVWDTNFVGIWHLHDDFLDSTINNNDGTNNGTANTAGQIGDAQDFVQSQSDRIDVADSASLHVSNAMTVSMWIKPNFNSTWTTLISKTTGTTSDLYWAFDNNNVFDVGLEGPIGADWYPGTAISDGVWDYFAVTFDGANVKVWKNGTEDAFTPGTVDMLLASNTNPLYFGWNTRWTNEYYNGAEDEIRISNIARSADWMATDYNTQSNAAGSITVGPEELTPFPSIESGVAVCLQLPTAMWM